MRPLRIIAGPWSSAPNYAEAHNNFGNALYELGRLNDAVACYRKAFELEPGSAEVHNNLGNAYYDQGNLDEAVTEYRRALALKDGFAEAHLNLGVALQDLCDPAGAEASYKRALETDPEDALGAALLLASLGLEQIPIRASEAHLQKLYVKRSQSWNCRGKHIILRTNWLQTHSRS